MRAHGLVRSHFPIRVVIYRSLRNSSCRLMWETASEKRHLLSFWEKKNFTGKKPYCVFVCVDTLRMKRQKSLTLGDTAVGPLPPSTERAPRRVCWFWGRSGLSGLLRALRALRPLRPLRAAQGSQAAQGYSGLSGHSGPFRATQGRSGLSGLLRASVLGEQRPHSACTWKILDAPKSMHLCLSMTKWEEAEMPLEVVHSAQGGAHSRGTNQPVCLRLRRSWNVGLWG